MATEEVFSNNFDSEPWGPYTSEDLQNYWGVNTTKDLYGAVEIVSDPDSSGVQKNAMRVFYAADNYGKRGGSGAQWPVRFSGPVSYTHLTLPTTDVVCRSRWAPCQ